ncbi:MAG: hypothetical protein CUN55_16860 [Phototrophicales bacterium]|nr:MAG: hypothetical protein CUN55_16860 [Phototrophicales bacterium]
MLYLHFLGFPEIRFEDKIIDNFISNKVHVLLAYLVLNPNIHSRERLASLLWEEMPTKRAKANLRQALHNLQTALPEYITADRQTVYFISDLPYQCDVELLQTIDEALGKEEVLTEHLQMAVDLYRGRFLEGIVLNEETEIADWIYRQQEMLQVAYIRVLAELAQRYVQSAEWSKALQCCQKI